MCFNFQIQQKTKSKGFQWKEDMKTKIVMNRNIIEQVRDFNYLGCNISYCKKTEVNYKINKFQGMHGTISRNSN